MTNQLEKFSDSGFDLAITSLKNALRSVLDQIIRPDTAVFLINPFLVGEKSANVGDPNCRAVSQRIPRYQ